LLLKLFGEKGPRFGGAYPNNKEAKGIILMNELATAENAYSKRATVGECFESIVNDLIKAKDLIGDNQIPANTMEQTPGFTDNDYTKDYGWAQKPAVIALLGKVYLFMNDSEKAKAEFELVIADSRFELDKPVNFTDYIQHNDNNVESIFALQFYVDANGEKQHQVARTNTDVPGAWKNTFIDARTFTRFGSDPRIYEATLYDHTWKIWSTNSAPPVWKTIDPAAPDFRCYTRKYVNYYDVKSPRDNTKNQELIRLADVYLMYAETVLALGNTSLATEYVNKVRRRAWGEEDYNSPGTKGEDFSTVDLSIIQEERYKELFFEYNRWFDLCRWTILESELAKYPTTRAGVVTYNDHDYYLPIPESEIKSNTLLEQSEGY
jgi:starch-binding outer membrane protein, SusD/RagB family